MSDLELRLRNGSVVAVDPETGDTVPLSLGDTEHESVEADDASVTNAPSADTDVARKSEVDEKADDPHDNSAHSETFVSDGDGTERQIWVIANGASDPEDADPEDIILEEES